MAAPAVASRSARSGSSAPKIDFGKLITTAGSGLPNRYILHAVEGWGKTSLGAQFPKPIFIQSRGETGLETLIDSNRLGEIPHFPAFDSWQAFLDAIDFLRTEAHDFKTVIIDTLNGIERLCYEHVCTRDFDGVWTDSGFEGYGRGYKVAMADWREMLARLDTLRAERKMTVVCLCHTKVVTFKNPEGADFDRYQPDIYKEAWSLAHKWADCVLFGNFVTVTYAEQTNKRTGEKKGKGSGGNARVLYTVRHAAYDAKNRLGLPDEIDMGESPEDAWSNLRAAIIDGRKKEVVEEQQNG